MNVDFDRFSRAAFVLLRMVTGFLFFQIGANKILGWHGGMPPDGSTAVFPSQIWIGGMLELVGGIAVLVGLFTRPVAFVLSGEMAVAYWQFHFARDKVWPVENGGTPAVLFCFVFLYFAAAGAGPWSLDALLRRRRLAGGPAATPRTSLADRTYEGSTVHARPRNAGGGGAPGSPGSPYARPAAAEGPGDAPSGPSPVGPADPLGRVRPLARARESRLRRAARPGGSQVVPRVHGHVAREVRAKLPRPLLQHDDEPQLARRVRRRGGRSAGRARTAPARDLRARLHRVDLATARGRRRDAAAARGDGERRGRQLPLRREPALGGSIRDWWRERDRILEWARRSLSETRHDPADCELGAPEASDHDALRALIAYYTGPAERDLRRYAFFLAERRAPKDGEAIPPL